MAPHSSAAVAVAVKTSWKPSCRLMPYPGMTPYRPCHVSSRLIIERTMAKRACWVSHVPFVAPASGKSSNIMPSLASSASQ